MAQIDIAGTNYDAYADVAFADAYLAADIARATGWDGLDAAVKARAMISASRLIASQSWANGSAPAYDLADIDAAAALAIQEATAILAADIAADPTIIEGFGGKRETKRVKAGAAEVEYFYDSKAPLPLPRGVWLVLISTGLLGSAGGGHGEPVYSGGGLDTRFPDRDWPESDYSDPGGGHL